jgi:uncharacterized membrane protein YesL
MDRIFSLENPLMSVVWKVLQMVELSILWILGCLPVVTIGISTVSLYYAIQKCLKNDRGYALRSYIQAWKQNWKQAVKITVPILIAAFIFFLDQSILEVLSEDNPVLSVGVMLFEIINAIIILYSIWVMTMLARFQNTTKKILMNAGMIMVRHLSTTILIGLILTGCAFVLWLVPGFSLIVPAVGMWLVSVPVEKVYRRYMTEQERLTEDILNQTVRH